MGFRVYVRVRFRIRIRGFAGKELDNSDYGYKNPHEDRNAETCSSASAEKLHPLRQTRQQVQKCHPGQRNPSYK